VALSKRSARGSLLATAVDLRLLSDRRTLLDSAFREVEDDFPSLRELEDDLSLERELEDEDDFSSERELELEELEDLALVFFSFTGD